MMNFFTRYRLTRLNENLAVALAVDEAERKTSDKTGVIYPGVVRANTATIARLKFKIEQLKGK